MLKKCLLILVGIASSVVGSELNITTRLVGGPFSNEGRLEVQGPDGEWGSFCRRTSSKDNADEITLINDLACGLCRSMGYLGSFEASNHHHAYGRSDGVIWYQGGNCHCGEDVCELQPWALDWGSCDHRWDLSMTCLTTDLRLTNGSSQREGWLEIGLGGDRVVSVIENPPHSLIDADLVCLHFGFPLALAVLDGVDLPRPADPPKPTMVKLACKANEARITDCLSRSVCNSYCGRGYSQSIPFGVKCATDDEVLAVSTTQKVFPDGLEVRLGDNHGQLSGLLHVRHNKSTWGRACVYGTEQTRAMAEEACLRLGSPYVQSTSFLPALEGNAGLELLFRVDRQSKIHWLQVEKHCAKYGGRMFNVTCKEGFTLNGITVFLPDFATCRGFCGALPSIVHTCGCDALCHEFKDCCFDVKSACPLQTNQSPANANQTQGLSWLTGNSLYYECHYDESLRHSYQLVSKCPQSWSDVAVREYCEEPSFQQAILYHSRNETYIPFKSAACALCHNLAAVRVSEGEPIFVPPDAGTPMISPMGDNESVTAAYFAQTPIVPTPIVKELTFHPIDSQGDSVHLRACSLSGTVTSDCLLADTSEDLREACRAYSAEVRSGRDLRAFKNPHCALCNGISQEELILAPTSIDIIPCCDRGDGYKLTLSIPEPMQTRTSLTITIGEEISCLLKDFKVVTKVGEASPDAAADSPHFSQTAFSALECILRAVASFHIELALVFSNSLKQLALMSRNSTEDTAYVSSPAYAYSSELENIVSDILLTGDTRGDKVESYWRRKCDATEITLKEECVVHVNDISGAECFRVVGNVTTATINGTQYMYLGEGIFVTPSNVSLFVTYEKDQTTKTFTKRKFAQICGVVPKNMGCDILPEDQAEWTKVADQQLIWYHGSALNESSFVILPDGYIVVCTITTVSYPDPFEGPEYVIQMVCTSLSLLALAATIATYCVFPSLRNAHGLTVLSMSAAIFIGQFLLLFGLNQTGNHVFCTVVAIITHYSWLAAFAWMTAIAWDLKRTFSAPVGSLQAAHNSHTFLWLSLFGWCSPLVVLIPCLVVSFCDCTDLSFSYGRKETRICWISDEAAILVSFGLPIVLSLCANVVLFSLTVRAIRTTKRASSLVNEDKDKRTETLREVVIYVKISSVMGFAWIIGFVALATDVSVLWFLFIISAALQGVFIFTSFAFNNRVRDMWKKKLRPKKKGAHVGGPALSDKGVNANEVTDGTASASV